MNEIKMDKPVAPFAHQLLRYHGVPQEGVVASTFVLEMPCTDFTASTVMQYALHLKRRDYVLLYYFS